MNAVDANILVYAFDRDESVKQPVAFGLVSRLAAEEPPVVLLWQAAAEFLACLRRWERAGKITVDDVRDYFAEVRGLLPLVEPDASLWNDSFLPLRAIQPVTLGRAIDRSMHRSRRHDSVQRRPGCGNVLRIGHGGQSVRSPSVGMTVVRR
jgi:hypothetical protein